MKRNFFQIFPTDQKKTDVNWVSRFKYEWRWEFPSTFEFQSGRITQSNPTRKSKSRWLYWPYFFWFRTEFLQSLIGKLQDQEVKIIGSFSWQWGGLAVDQSSGPANRCLIPNQPPWSCIGISILSDEKRLEDQEPRSRSERSARSSHEQRSRILQNKWELISCLIKQTLINSNSRACTSITKGNVHNPVRSLRIISQSKRNSNWEI